MKVTFDYLPELNEINNVSDAYLRSLVKQIITKK